jgi:hypothetical protein
MIISLPSSPVTALSQKAKANSNGKRHATQQSVNSAVKAICDIMRRSNCAGALQYVPELTWIATPPVPRATLALACS